MLSTTDFLTQQSTLGEAYAGLVQVQDQMESALTELALVTDVEATIDLTTPYSQNLDAVQVSSQVGRLQTATLALIGHVQNRSGQSINDWLFTNNLKVTQNFADLCGALGTTINALNIE
jgi:hypothetical protein